MVKCIFYKNGYSLLVMVVSLIAVNSCTPFSLQQPSVNNSTHATFTGDTHSVAINTDYEDFNRVLNKTGCKNFKSYIWNYIYNVAYFEKGETPPYYTVKENIIKKINLTTKNNPQVKQNINKFALHFVEIYALLTEFLAQNKQEKTISLLVQFEHGIIPQEKSEFFNNLNQKLINLEQIGKTINTHCDTKDTIVTTTFNTFKEQQLNTPLFTILKNKLHPLVYGAKKIMAIAYQNCSVLNLPLMPIEHNTKGINIMASHADGTGEKRTISNLNNVLNSHYYLSQTPTTNNNECFNIHSQPLIYDYGGKPHTAKNSINLFQNSGSGSHVLGIDCSGFVASAMAGAGLRLRPNVPIRSIHVKGINSWMFKTAQSNNLSCLHKQDISFHNSIKSGDIIATNFHVFIIEDVGDDPFNLQSITSEDQCAVKNIQSEHFNLNIIQSSAHNNGVGINRMNIKDLDPQGVILIGLKKIASKICYSRFNQIQESTQDKKISILRHDSDNPSCLDNEMYIEKQECLNSCQSFSI